MALNSCPVGVLDARFPRCQQQAGILALREGEAVDDAVARHCELCFDIVALQQHVVIVGRRRLKVVVEEGGAVLNGRGR